MRRAAATKVRLRRDDAVLRSVAGVPRDDRDGGGRCGRPGRAPRRARRSSVRKAPAAPPSVRFSPRVSAGKDAETVEMATRTAAAGDESGRKKNEKKNEKEKREKKEGVVRLLPPRSLLLPVGPGVANAVRRTLLSDVPSWAPFEVVFQQNTSCHTDEFLAHRIGMLPFVRVGNGDELTIGREGPGLVRAGAVRGPSFDPVHPSIEIARLGEGEVLFCKIRFDEGTPSRHARYGLACGVGMRKVAGAGGGHALTFSSVDGRDPLSLLLVSLDLLERRVDDCLRQLSSQPTIPPRSYA